jgi:hypothetical protein
MLEKEEALLLGSNNKIVHENLISIDIVGVVFLEIGGSTTTMIILLHVLDKQQMGETLIWKRSNEYVVVDFSINGFYYSILNLAFALQFVPN